MVLEKFKNCGQQKNTNKKITISTMFGYSGKFIFDVTSTTIGTPNNIVFRKNGEFADSKIILFLLTITQFVHIYDRKSIQIRKSN